MGVEIAETFRSCAHRSLPRHVTADFPGEARPTQPPVWPRAPCVALVKKPLDIRAYSRRPLDSVRCSFEVLQDSPADRIVAKDLAVQSGLRCESAPVNAAIREIGHSARMCLQPGLQPGNVLFGYLLAAFHMFAKAPVRFLALN